MKLRSTCWFTFIDQPPMAGLPPHGLDEWLTELRLFPDWYVPAVGLDPIDVEGWDAAWREVLEPVADDGLGPVTVLRDYHAENVMLLDGRGGIGRFGLLDFQDALAGHPAYDLVSVLEDARRDVPPELEREMIDRYREQDRRRRAVRARLLGAGGAAQHPHPRRLLPLVEARRQGSLQAVPAAHVGPAGARSGAAGAGARPAAGSTPISRHSRRAAAWHGSGMNRKARALALRPEIEAAVPDTAMVMAAGLGKRMRPLTATRPKPLVEVAGKALIDHALDRLRAAGVSKIVVNVHYLADALEAHLKARASDFDVRISDERKLLLETGGGLIQAETDDRRRPVPGRQQRQLLDRRAGRHAAPARFAVAR